MKILKIAGVVAGIHAFFLILIFVIPGCSSTTKPPPEPVDTIQPAAAPSITVPAIASAAPAASTPAPAPAISPFAAPPPTGFNPDAPATYGDSTGGVHFTPTRPNSPVVSALQAQPVADVTPAATYSVKSGDNLWTLAKKNHILVSELAAANNLRTSAVLHEGQKLIIPGKSVSSAPAASRSSSTAAPAAAAGLGATTKSTEAAAPAKGSAEDMKHVVKSGETLGEIARKYGVKSGTLAERNSISDPQKLRAGTELIIPGWKSTSGKAGKASSSSDSAAKATSTSTPSMTEPEPAPQPVSNPVPDIHIDDNPMTPAPKP